MEFATLAPTARAGLHTIMAADEKRLTFVNDNPSTIGKETAERVRVVKSHVMIGIHSRPRSVPVWNFFPAPKGNQTAKSPETNRKTTSLPSFDGAHESTENVTRQSGSLPITSGRGTCGGSDGSVSSSNTSLQLIDGDNSAENSSDQEQHISLPRESLTRLDQSISDPLNASGCVIFHNVLFSNQREVQIHKWAVYHAILATPAARYSILAKAIMHLGMVMTISDNSIVQDKAAFREYTSKALMYKARTTRLISQTLSTANATSDPTFFAILDMVCCYTSMGETGEITQHIKGLNTLLGLRGGIEQLSPFLAYRVLQADNVVAAMTGGLPIVDVSNIVLFPLHDQLIAAFGGIPIPDIDILYTLLVQAFDLEDFVSRLSPTVLLFYRYLLIQSSGYYEVLCYSNEYQQSLFQLHLTQAIRLATIIYIEINLVNVWRFSTVLDSLVQRLKASLELTALKTFWMPYCDALLLVLLLGGIGGAGRLERAWFVERLAIMALTLDLHDFTAVEDMLGRRVARGMVGRTLQLMRRLWEDVQAENLIRMRESGFGSACPMCLSSAASSTDSAH